MVMSGDDEIIMIHGHTPQISANKPNNRGTGGYLLFWSYLKTNGQCRVL